jgi:heat shock protein HtpX
MGLRLAIVLTFLILGILLWAVFWAAMWILGISGSAVIWGTFAFVGFMIFIQWLIGPVILKALVRMKECTDKKITDMVYKIADEARIPRPKVYIVENPAPNAFAFGRTQKSSNVALHTGLLEKLSDDEVRAVIAHEVGHIKHRDVLVMTLASALPVLLFYIIYFGTIFAGSRDRGGGLNYLGAWIGGMVAQFLAMLLVLYLSRVREYHADAYSAYATKKPTALANALAKIAYSLAREKPTPATTNTNLRTFYIADPMMAASAEYRGQMEVEKSKGFIEIFLTHPLTFKRIHALEKIEKEMVR